MSRDLRGSITKDVNPTGINQYNGGGGKKAAAAAPAAKGGAKEPVTVRPAGESKGHAIPAKPESGHGGKGGHAAHLTGEHLLGLKGGAPMSKYEIAAKEAKSASARADSTSKKADAGKADHATAVMHAHQAIAAHRAALNALPPKEKMGIHTSALINHTDQMAHHDVKAGGAYGPRNER